MKSNEQNSGDFEKVNKFEKVSKRVWLLMAVFPALCFLQVVSRKNETHLVFDFGWTIFSTPEVLIGFMAAALLIWLGVKVPKFRANRVLAKMAAAGQSTVDENIRIPIAFSSYVVGLAFFESIGTGGILYYALWNNLTASIIFCIIAMVAVLANPPGREKWLAYFE